MNKKTVLITGGAQGIGRTMAAALFDDGWHVAVMDSDAEALNEFRDGCTDKGRFLFLEGDVSVENEVASSIDEILKSWGRIDGLVNNAAIAVNKPIKEVTYGEWTRVINVNLSSVFLTVKHAEDALKKAKGAVVNICSTRTFMSEPHTEAYSASKGGVFALTHALALSLGPHVRVNAVSPGWIEVGHLKKKSAARKVALSDEDHNQHPAGRVGKPEDIASLVRFLLSGESGFITGANFIVDGGMTRKMIYY
ncbi:MAG: SDR family oxidoreductase [Spirochaetales bacterium]|nr:SDR family oxidoreductase [Spirochaetales bacterium]